MICSNESELKHAKANSTNSVLGTETVASEEDPELLSHFLSTIIQTLQYSNNITQLEDEHNIFLSNFFI